MTVYVLIMNIHYENGYVVCGIFADRQKAQWACDKENIPYVGSSLSMPFQVLEEEVVE